MDKVRAVLSARLTALEDASRDVENQITFFNEQLGTQYERSNSISEERDQLYAALESLDAAFPQPTPEYDDIPF
jgi:hypothetical protein